MSANPLDRCKSAWRALAAGAADGPTDRVYTRGNVLVFEFSLTGVTGLPAYVDLNALLTGVGGFRIAEREGAWELLYADAGLKGDRIERFDSQESAAAARDLTVTCFQRALTRKVRRRRAATMLALAVAGLLFLPLGHRQTGGGNVAAAASMKPADAPGGLSLATMPPTSQPESLPAPSAEAMLSEFAGDAMSAQVQVDLKQVKAMRGFDGGGKGAEIWVLVDPQCEYCKALEKELANGIKDDKLNVHYVPVPIKGGQSGVLTAEVLCNESPLQAWGNAMFTGTVHTDISNKEKLAVCANDTMNNLKTFINLKMKGTPTIVAANGMSVMGAMPLDKLIAWAKSNS
ncbi:MAG: thioredoxin fold domain-containing protein [Burkholderia sp.]